MTGSLKKKKTETNIRDRHPVLPRRDHGVKDDEVHFLRLAVFLALDEAGVLRRIRRRVDGGVPRHFELGGQFVEDGFRALRADAHHAENPVRARGVAGRGFAGEEVRGLGAGRGGGREVAEHDVDEQARGQEGGGVEVGDGAGEGVLLRRVERVRVLDLWVGEVWR